MPTGKNDSSYIRGLSQESTMRDFIKMLNEASSKEIETQKRVNATKSKLNKIYRVDELRAQWEAEKLRGKRSIEAQEKSNQETLKKYKAHLESKYKSTSKIESLMAEKKLELDAKVETKKKQSEKRELAFYKKLQEAQQQVANREEQINKIRLQNDEKRKAVSSKILSLDDERDKVINRIHNSEAQITSAYNEQNNLRAKRKQLESQLSSETDVEKRAELEAEIADVLKTQEQVGREIAKAKKDMASDGAVRSKIEQDILKFTQLQIEAESSHLSKGQALENVYKKISEKSQELKDIDIQIEALVNSGGDASDLEARRELLKEEEKMLERHADSIKDTKGKSASTRESIKNRATEIGREKEVEKEKNSEEAAAQWKYFLSKDGAKNGAEKALANAIGELGNQLADFSKSIDENIDSFFQYQASIDARLQNFESTHGSYQKLLNKVSSNVAFSSVVSQKQVVEKIKELVDKGVAYNVELRAFLATVSDNIATTFDAFDSNLLRIIRIQQADTTAARLGMEASLTRLFNEFFSDTSYLSDAFDAVSGAILEASSMLTRDQSTEFDYIVQKWLGSLYSVGVSDSAVNTIAEGLNLLGTGNVTALNSNESMQTLMAMSAAKAGVSYADILTGGLDAETTNKLLKSMVEYLQSIANNTDNNQVTKSAYANLFGISATDIRAISNLTQDDVNNISKQTLNYSQAIDELTYQFGEVSSRVHASQKLDTIIQNVLMSTATGIGSSTALYGTWKVLNIVEDLTGGIPIPMVSVMGNTVDLKQTVTGLAKLPIAGLGLMGSLLSGLSSGGGIGNTFSLDAWGFDATTSRGSLTKGIAKGITSGVSQSQDSDQVMSTDPNDVKQSSMSDATKGAEEDSKTTNAGVSENTDIYEQIRDALVKDEISVLDVAHEIKTLLNTDRVFNTSMAGMSSIENLLAPNRVFFTLDTLHTTGGKFNIDGIPNSNNLVFDYSAATPSAMGGGYSFTSVLSNELSSISKSSGVTINGTSVTVTSTGGDSSDASLEVITNLSTSVSNIEALYNELTTNGKSINVEVKNPDSIVVKALSDDLRNSLKSMLKEALATTLINGATDEDESGGSLADSIAKSLSGMNVRVDNTNFQELIDKLVFTSI